MNNIESITVTLTNGQEVTISADRIELIKMRDPSPEELQQMADDLRAGIRERRAND